MEIQEKNSHALLKKSNQNHRTEANEDIIFYLRKRYLVTMLVFIGWFLLITMRTNLSISIVDMTSMSNKTIGNTTVIREAEFKWSSVEKGIILSLCSWGLCISPLGALLATKVGSVNVFGGVTFVTALLTLVTPLLVRWNVPAFLVSLIFQGIFEGFASSTYMDVIVQWSPPTERSRLLWYAFFGIPVGVMLSYPICGSIVYYLDWATVFYVTGGVGILWYIIWLIFVGSTPANDKFITSKEKKYVCNLNQFTSVGKVVYPWKRIIFSKPVWAYFNNRFVEALCVSFLSYCLPLYMKDLYDVNIQDIGMLSGIPQVCCIIGGVVAAHLSDYLRNRKILTRTNIHKLYFTIGQSAAIVALIILSAWRNSFVSIVCLCLFRLGYSWCDVTYLVLPADMGAHYASIIVGFGYVLMSFGFALNPIVMGMVVSNHSTAEWSTYFWFLSVFNVWGLFIFYKFGSGKLQSWVKSSDKNKNVVTNDENKASD